MSNENKDKYLAAKAEILSSPVFQQNSADTGYLLRTVLTQLQQAYGIDDADQQEQCYVDVRFYFGRDEINAPLSLWSTDRIYSHLPEYVSTASFEHALNEMYDYPTSLVQDLHEALKGL